MLRVKRKTKQAVGRAIERLLKPYKGMCQTITFDNGGEFSDHAAIAHKLNCRIYFAKPYLLATRAKREQQRPITPLLPEKDKDSAYQKG